MNKKKAIIIIGGGDLGLNTVIWAKELGLFTIVTDRNPEASGLKEADLPINIDGEDVWQQVFLGASPLRYKYNLVGIYCCNDFGLLSVAYVSETLELPSHSCGSVTQALSKAWANEILRENNIPVPKSIVVSTLPEAKKAFAKVGVPAIVKPTNSSGSQGARVITSSDDLIQAYGEAAHFGRMLIQEFIDGRSIDVNGLFIEDKFYGCGVLEKFMGSLPYRLPIEGCDPARLPAQRWQEAYSLLEEACRALGITSGPVDADMILTKDGFKILEVSPRFHGDLTTSCTLPFATGINPVKAYFNYLMVGSLPLGYLMPIKENIGYWRVIQLPQGRIKKISGLEEARKINGVTKIWLRVEEGDAVGNYHNTAEIPGVVCVFGEDKATTDNIFKEVYGVLKFEIEVCNEIS